MSNKNGKEIITYKDGRTYRDGKLAAIGLKPGEHIPRASDFKLPGKLSELDKKVIEMGRKINKSLNEAYLNEQKSKRQKASS